MEGTKGKVKHHEEESEKDNEMLENIAEVDKGFKEIKTKRDNILENFTIFLKKILSFYRKKSKNEKVNDELFLATARMIEFSLMEKDFNYADKLTDEEKSDLVKFFYQIYERVTKKQSVSNLKLAKVYPAHQSLLASQGVGVVHRSMFSIQK
jgi:hypothetical protein